MPSGGSFGWIFASSTSPKITSNIKINLIVGPFPTFMAVPSGRKKSLLNAYQFASSPPEGTPSKSGSF
jgi:hypothetical protein